MKLQQGDLLTGSNAETENVTDKKRKDLFEIGVIQSEYKDIIDWVCKYLTALKWDKKEGACKASLKYSAGKVKKTPLVF